MFAANIKSAQGKPGLAVTDPSNVWAPYGSFVSALQFKYYGGVAMEWNAFRNLGQLDLVGGSIPITVPMAINCNAFGPGAGGVDFLYSGTATNTCALRDVGRGVLSPVPSPPPIGLVNQVGRGYPNFWTALNGEKNPVAIPPVATFYAFGGGTDAMRWGETSGTTSLNPFQVGTVPLTAGAEYDVIYEVYDTVLKENPTNSAQVFCWMCDTFSSFVDGNGDIHYIFELRQNLRWHDGESLSCNDIRFTFLNFRDVPVGSIRWLADVSSIISVNVLDPFHCDVVMSGPASSLQLQDLADVPIIPQHIWDSGNNFYGQGVGSANPLMTGPIDDPLTAGTFIGSGPFVCQSVFALDQGRVGTGFSCDTTCTRIGQSVGPGGKILLEKFDFTGQSGTVDPFYQYMRSYNVNWGTGTGVAAESGQFQEFQWADGLDGDAVVNIGDLVSVAGCYGASGVTAACAASTYNHWLRPVFHPDSPCTIGVMEVAIGSAHLDDQYVSPFPWSNPTLDNIVPNSPTSPLPFPPICVLSPNSGLVGSSVTVSGCGFAASSSVTISFDGSAVATTTTDGAGSYSTSFIVPPSNSGPHTIKALDAALNLATATFTVTSNPSLTLNPTSGKIGSSVTAYDFGFAASSSVTITFDGSIVATTATDASGSFSTSFIVPSSSPGSHTVTGTDASSNSATATFTVVPSVNVSPTSGIVGSPVTVSGSNFAASSSVTVTFGSGTGSPLILTTVTDSAGSFSISFNVPVSLAGTRPIIATDASSNTASTTFTVIPSITLSPTSGGASSTVTVSGFGFAGSSTVTITFDSSHPTQTSSDTTGSFSRSYGLPGSSTGGPHTITATDASSNSASATFTIVSSITLSPTSGNVGSTVMVSGTNFASSSTVTISYDGTVLSTSPPTITTSNSGTFTATFTVPASTTSGNTVTATDASSDSASAIFRNNGVIPSITPNPTSGPVGSQVMVSGTGFASSSTVTISYNGIVQSTSPPTITTSGSGSFTATFTVPASRNGGNTVMATDAVSDSASTGFMVTSSILLNPMSGTDGSLVSISGTGFQNSHSVTITFGSSTVATTSTDSNGSFSTFFNVPSSSMDAVGGAHIVTAAGGGSSSATATFTITPSITLSPTSGAAGSTVIVSGSGFAGGSSVTITFDGVTVATTSTGGAGHFSISFIVPSSASGPHTVKASDASNNSANAIFTIP